MRGAASRATDTSPATARARRYGYMIDRDLALLGLRQGQPAHHGARYGEATDLAWQ